MVGTYRFLSFSRNKLLSLQTRAAFLLILSLSIVPAYGIVGFINKDKNELI